MCVCVCQRKRANTGSLSGTHQITYSIVWKKTTPGALQGARSHYWAPCKAPNSKDSVVFFKVNMFSIQYSISPIRLCLRGPYLLGERARSNVCPVLAGASPAGPRPFRAIKIIV